MSRLDDSGLTLAHGPCQDRHELPEITRPPVRTEKLHGTGIDRGFRPRRILELVDPEFGDLEPGKIGDVVSPLSERRKLKPYPIQPEVQILAEFPILNRQPEIFV